MVTVYLICITWTNVSVLLFLLGFFVDLKLINKNLKAKNFLIVNLLSTIYEILYSHNLLPLDLLKNKWETDLNEPITEDTWHKTIERIFSSSICLRHAVFQFKIVHRLHSSKIRLSKSKAKMDPTCD